MSINEEPIFIGGAGRSGKTLLRVMLDSHPNIVLDFLGEPWSDSVLRYHELPHQFIDESSADEVQQPIFGTDIGRWERDMSDEDKAQFKREAGDLLENLGYARGEW